MYNTYVEPTRHTAQVSRTLFRTAPCKPGNDVIIVVLPLNFRCCTSYKSICTSDALTFRKCTYVFSPLSSVFPLVFLEAGQEPNDRECHVAPLEVGGCRCEHDCPARIFVFALLLVRRHLAVSNRTCPPHEEHLCKPIARTAVWHEYP